MKKDAKWYQVSLKNLWSCCTLSLATDKFYQYLQQTDAKPRALENAFRVCIKSYVNEIHAAIYQSKQNELHTLEWLVFYHHLQYKQLFHGCSSCSSPPGLGEKVQHQPMRRTDSGEKVIHRRCQSARLTMHTLSSTTSDTALFFTARAGAGLLLFLLPTPANTQCQKRIKCLFVKACTT